MYYTDENKQPGKDQSQSNPLNESHETRDETNGNEAAYQKLLRAFESLAKVTDRVRFEVEFEQEQKKSGLRLGTYRKAYRAWTAQRKKGGE